LLDEAQWFTIARHLDDAPQSLLTPAHREYGVRKRTFTRFEGLVPSVLDGLNSWALSTRERLERLAHISSRSRRRALNVVSIRILGGRRGRLADLRHFAARLGEVENMLARGSQGVRWRGRLNVSRMRVSSFSWSREGEAACRRRLSIGVEGGEV